MLNNLLAWSGLVIQSLSWVLDAALKLAVSHPMWILDDCSFRPVPTDQLHPPRMLYILLKSSRGKYCAFSTRIFVLSRKMFSKGLEEFVFQILIFQYDNYFKFSILEEDCVWNSFESLALNGRVIDHWWQWHYRKQLVVFCFALVHMQS